MHRPASRNWAHRRATRRAGRLLLDVALVAAVLLFAFLAIGPRLLPYRTVTMLTGSMRSVSRFHGTFGLFCWPGGAEGGSAARSSSVIMGCSAGLSR